MFEKIKKPTQINQSRIALTISIFTYLLFFGSVLLNSERTFWTSDITNKFHPARTYLHQEIAENRRFPFWTEKVYAGFPIYADLENAYLHPYNILISVLFEPFAAYKIIHFSVYLLGSFGMYLFLRNRGIGLLGYSVANLIFFFNFFITNHQIHQSMLLTLYTLPLSLYLLDEYFSTKNHKYTALNILAITSAFYWGHPQMFILYLMGLFLYLIFFIDKNPFNSKVIYMLFMGWFVFLLSLPQLLPTWELKSQSIRSFEYESISAEEGSFNPLMFSTLFYPKLFLNPDSYHGLEINEEYSITETYNYIGVSTFIIFLFTLVFLRNQRLTKYVLASFTIYLLLSYSRFIPFFSLESVPIINLFRYWTRSVVLFIFPVSFLVGYCVDKLFKATSLFKDFNFKSVAYIVGLLFVLFVLNTFGEDTKKILENIPFYLSQSYYLKKWVVISFSVLALLLFIYRFAKLKHLKFISLALVFIVFVDLWHLGKNMTNYRIDNITELEKVTVSDEFSNNRIILEKGNVEYNETLYYDFWALFGYSQFVEKKYLNKYLENNVYKVSNPTDEALDSSKYNFYRELGVSSLVFDRETVVLNDSSLDLVANDIEGSYLLKKEGNIIFNVDSPSATKLSTYIKNYPGWQVAVNGKKVKIDAEPLFINFDIAQGNSIVSMKFIPKTFYLGVVLSLIGLSASVLALQKPFLKSKFML